MNKDDMLKYALIAGGAFAVYWYVTNHGPGGAVYASDGVTKLTPSYWDTWFGTAASTPALTQAQIDAANAAALAAKNAGQTPAQIAAAALAAAQAACVAPNTWNNSTGVCTPYVAPSAPTALEASVTSQILAKAGVGPATVMNADQWGYYYNQIETPLTTDQFGAVFPTRPSGNMTAAQWVQSVADRLGWTSTTTLSGFGDVVPVQSRPSVPMMSFGGAFNQPFQPKKGWS